MPVVSSVVTSDAEALTSISALYLSNEPFDCDPTYSSGVFYRKFPEPRLKFDLDPQDDDVVAADVANLPLPDKSVQSIVFDPPFMFGAHGQTKNNIMNKRFTMFDSWNDLSRMYQSALSEFRRVLVAGGYVAFKCQDYTDTKTTLTHCYVHEWARGAGFAVEDLFILVAQGGRIYNPNLVQRHARKWHSYWFVLRNKR